MTEILCIIDTIRLWSWLITQKSNRETNHGLWIIYIYIMLWISHTLMCNLAHTRMHARTHSLRKVQKNICQIGQSRWLDNQHIHCSVSASHQLSEVNSVGQSWTVCVGRHWSRKVYRAGQSGMIKVRHLHVIGPGRCARSDSQGQESESHHQSRSDVWESSSVKVY